MYSKKSPKNVPSHAAKCYNVTFCGSETSVLMCMYWTVTLLPGLGPLFFGILIGSAWVWVCCRAILCAQLAGNLPLVRPGPVTGLPGPVTGRPGPVTGRPGPVTGRPGPAMASSSQPALFAQPNCKQRAKETQSQVGLTHSCCDTPQW